MAMPSGVDHLLQPSVKLIKTSSAVKYLFLMFDHAFLFSHFDFSLFGELYPWSFVQRQKGTSSLSLELYFIILNSANMALTPCWLQALGHIMKFKLVVNLFLMGAQLLPPGPGRPESRQPAS